MQTGPSAALDRPAITAAVVLVLIGDVLTFGSMLAAMVAVALRYWSSRGTQRQQLRWAAFGAGFAVVLYFVFLTAARAV